MNSTIRLKNLFRLALTLCLCIGISSCENEPGGADESTSSKNMIIGEWKAVKIEATFINGEVSTYTDPSFIESELEEMD